MLYFGISLAALVIGMFIGKAVFTCRNSHWRGQQDALSDLLLGIQQDFGIDVRKELESKAELKLEGNLVFIHTYSDTRVIGGPSEGMPLYQTVYFRDKKK